MHSALVRQRTPVSPPFRNSRPEGVAARDVRGLAPVDAFVLSRVDGRRSIEDIAVLVGLEPYETLQVLRALLASGHLQTLGPNAIGEPRVDDDVDEPLDHFGSIELDPFRDESLPIEAEALQSESDRPTVERVVEDPFSRPTRPVHWL